MERFFYQNNISGFLADSEDTILGILARNNSFDLVDLQRNAWLYEITFLKKLLHNESAGQIIFEYSIPRLGKRIDVVLLLHGIVFVLEFKVGADKYSRQDWEQVWDYALDLKNFHEASRDLAIVPILVATDAADASVSMEASPYDDHVFEPLLSNASSLPEIIARFTAKCAQNIDLSRWVFSRYMPTPTIIQAASSLYLNHSVAEITKTEASGENLQCTSEFVMNVIDHSRANHEKSICFVTGVPGAGKTLVGLNIAVQQFEKKDLAVYLSGNQPLVSVLSEALARDKKRQEEERNPDQRYPITTARRDVKSFIQIVHHYRDTTLSKLKKTIVNGALEIDPGKVDRHPNDGYSEVEHVAIFDEAQRAWTKEHLANWLSRKKGVADFPMSEPEFLIWSLNLREDWAVIVCLVGGGQEINTGEAGIGEWLRAINASFPDWNVFISDELTGKEYAELGVYDLLILDVMMPKIDGLQACMRIREFSNVPVIMLTARSEDTDKILGLSMGADDYVVKPFDLKELSARIKAVLRRYQSHVGQEDGDVIKFDNFEISQEKFELKLKGKKVDIPPKELQLLYCLASNPNHVFSREQLLEHVWDFAFLGDSRTVDVHIKRLREKIENVSDQWELKTVWGVGYKFEVEDGK